MFFWFYWHWLKKTTRQTLILDLVCFPVSCGDFPPFLFLSRQVKFCQVIKEGPVFLLETRLSAHYQPLWSKTLLTMALSFIFQIDSFVLCSWYLVLFALRMNEQIPPVETKWIKQLLIWLTGHPSKHRRRQWAVILVQTRETSLQVRLFLPYISNCSHIQSETMEAF